MRITGLQSMILTGSLYFKTKLGVCNFWGFLFLMLISCASPFILSGCVYRNTVMYRNMLRPETNWQCFTKKKC